MAKECRRGGLCGGGGAFYGQGMKRTTGQDRKETRNWRPRTQAVRGGTSRSQHGETSEAIFLTSGYAYDSAGQAAARFREEDPGMTYSRLQNPTVEMLEERLALLEGAESCRVSASGMAAMTGALMGTLSAGDHLVTSCQLFGSNWSLIDHILPRFGIGYTAVDGRDNDAFRRAMRPNTKAVFVETPTNPTLDIVDMRAVADIAHEGGAILIVDNAFASPVLQRPLEFGADVVAYSATKLIDGQGRTLSGAVLGNARWMEEQYLAFTRVTGPNLSPFNAWLLLKSLETLELRALAASDNALRVARYLETRVPSLVYPGLPSHPQHELAMRQMRTGGTMLSVGLAGGRKQAHAVLDALAIIDISNNLGDTKTLMTHPSSTTHSGVSADDQKRMGIDEGMLRLSVGLEDADDLIEDLDQALKAAGV